MGQSEEINIIAKLRRYLLEAGYRTGRVSVMQMKRTTQFIFENTYYSANNPDIAYEVLLTYFWDKVFDLVISDRTIEIVFEN